MKKSILLAAIGFLEPQRSGTRHPFSPDVSFYDIIYCLRNYGLVPQEAMPGSMYGDSLPVHNELDAVAGTYV